MALPVRIQLELFLKVTDVKRDQKRTVQTEVSSRATGVHQMGLSLPWSRRLWQEAGSPADASFSFSSLSGNQRGKIPPRKPLCLPHVTSSSTRS